MRRSSPASTCAAARRGRGRPTCWRRGGWCAAVDALVLAGGSAFGLDAASGVVDRLRALGPRASGRAGVRGADRAGGDPLRPRERRRQGLGRRTPIRRSGARGASTRRREDFALGSDGAGTGAMTATLMGGLGSASIVTEERGDGRGAGRGQRLRQRRACPGAGRSGPEPSRSATSSAGSGRRRRGWRRSRRGR